MLYLEHLLSLSMLFGCRWALSHGFGLSGAFTLALLSGRAFFIDSQRPVPLSLARGSQK